MPGDTGESVGRAADSVISSRGVVPFANSVCSSFLVVWRSAYVSKNGNHSKVRNSKTYNFPVIRGTDTANIFQSVETMKYLHLNNVSPGVSVDLINEYISTKHKLSKLSKIDFAAKALISNITALSRLIPVFPISQKC